MNRDDIIRMAREAGLTDPDLGPWTIDYGDAENAITYFAALIAAAEREACAKVCDDLVLAYPGRADLTVKQCADAIRARGEQPKRHPGYIMGDHWLQAAYTRVCTGEDVRDVMAEYGWYP